MIKRLIEENINNWLFKGKIIVIYGARRVGKTTLIKQLSENYKDSSEYFMLDEPETNLKFSRLSADEFINSLKSTTKIVFLDEAQTIENIGLKLKILIDKYPQIQIVATGSSSFDLQNNVSYELTGRKIEFKLYPLSLGEIINVEGKFVISNNLDRIMTYGLYPSIYLNKESREETLLSELSDSYLFKDILMYQDVKNPRLLKDLLVALALQLGNEVSINELATLLNSNRETIYRYLDLLEKVFVIKIVRTFSRNLRNELNKKIKVYFWDLGIRNALINNFNRLSFRNDVGALWENFCFMERVKFHQKNREPSMFFWRTHEGSEIDLVEEIDGSISAFEFKFAKKNAKFPKAFAEAYKNSTFKVINNQNYLEELLK